MKRSLQYTLPSCYFLLGSLMLFSAVPAYGNPAVNNGFVRGLDGLLVPLIPNLPNQPTTNQSVNSSNENRVVVKSSTFVNDQGAGANVSATATSSNGVPSQTEVNQFTPGATSVSTQVTATSSNVSPNTTDAQVNIPAVAPSGVATPAAPVNNVAVPGVTVDSNVNSVNVAPSVNAVSTVQTPPTLVVPPPAVVPASITQVNTPEASFTTINSQAIAAPTVRSAPPSSPTTFIAPFGENSVSQNNAVNIQQDGSGTTIRENSSRSVNSYKVVGMPSRVWPGLGLTQVVQSSN